MAIYDQVQYGPGGNTVKKPKKPLDVNTDEQMVAFGPADGEQVSAGKTTNTPPTTPAAATNSGNSGNQPAATQPKETPVAAAPEAVKKAETFGYGPFSYGDYAKSDAVRQAEVLLQQQLAQKPGQYQSPWQTQLDDTIQKILNREDFSYDFNADALYQQYKDSYIQQGRMAMMDTMGQAQAMTGGYGSSYAQMVGQQAYNQQLGQLNDVIPELYQLALNRYLAEGDQMYDQAALLAQMEGQDFDRYQTELSNWYSQLDYLTGRYDTERNADYSQWLADRELAYNEHNVSRDQAWEEYLSNKEKEQAAAELMAGIGNYDRLGEVYGLSADEVAAFKTANTPKYTGGNPTPTYKTLEIGSDMYNDLMSRIKNAASLEELNGITSEYVYYNYNPADIYNSWAFQQKKSELSPTNDSVDTTVDNTLMYRNAGDTITLDDLKKQREQEILNRYGTKNGIVLGFTK